ncbi:MAG: phosphotransferase, partial [Deinococcota bacterium]
MSNIDMNNIDIEQPDDLRAYLLKLGKLEPNDTPTMQVLTGGVSNRTVLVSLASGQTWVLKQALEKLRVKVDWFSSPERIHREAAGMRYLHRVAPRHSTKLVFEDKTAHILAMEAVPTPHDNWKTMLLQGDVHLDHVEQFAEILATLHREAYLALQNSDAQAQSLQKEFADRAYFENLRLEPYYLYTAERVPEARPFLHELVDHTRQRLFTLVHGDYSPKNVLVHDHTLILLDHEVIHIGDPAFDLGFSMTHLLSKAHHVKAKRQAFVEASQLYWQHYLHVLGDVGFVNNLERYAVRHTLACLLARVAGRSPLEYLSPTEQAAQWNAVIDLM